MRRLRPDEAAAWRAVARTVRPMAGAIMPPVAPKRAEGGQPAAAQIPAVMPTPAPPARNRGPAPANTLDASWDRRIASGRIEPELTIDLHGETLSSAHARLNRSLDFAIRQRLRTILLITGRARPGTPRLPPTGRGVIRASVADWLAASPHAGRIAAIRNAHPRHGGAGALYLILRRTRHSD